MIHAGRPFDVACVIDRNWHGEVVVGMYLDPRLNLTARRCTATGRSIS